MSLIIVDLDGCLIDDSNRIHHLRHVPPNYDAYHDNIIADPPMLGTLRLVVAMYAAGHEIAISTARPDTYRSVTRAQLDKHHINHHYLFMRGKGDMRPSPDIKRDVVNQLRNWGKDILFALDDKISIIRMYNGMDILSFHIGGEDFEEVMPNVA